MTITFNLFPEGVSRALTMSYDDGQIHDLRLARLFDRYGIKGTFHLNSSNINRSGYLTDAILIQDLKNHEISAHTKTHPFLTKLPHPIVIDEILEDKRQLENMTGQIIRGMSYPYGQYHPDIITIARACGMEYSRTVESTNYFEVPDDFMMWHPTTHHNGPLTELWNKFINHTPNKMLLFYVWGHSFEFAAQNNWEIIENFCELAGGNDDIWYATNAEICEYVNATRSILFNSNQTVAYNPTATKVWFTADDHAVSVAPGQTLRL